MSTVFTYGTGGGAVTCTITKNPAYPREWYEIEYNQYVRDTADGGRVCYDNGPAIIEGVLILQNVPKDEVDNASTGLRKFIRDTLVFGKNYFTITPPTGVDLGKGDATAITCYFNGGRSLQSVFEFMQPGTFYNVTFPYREKPS